MLRRYFISLTQIVKAAEWIKHPPQQSMAEYHQLTNGCMNRLTWGLSEVYCHSTKFSIIVWVLFRNRIIFCVSPVLPTEMSNFRFSSVIEFNYLVVQFIHCHYSHGYLLNEQWICTIRLKCYLLLPYQENAIFHWAMAANRLHADPICIPI